MACCDEAMLPLSLYGDLEPIPEDHDECLVDVIDTLPPFDATVWTKGLQEGLPSQMSLYECVYLMGYALCIPHDANDEKECPGWSLEAVKFMAVELAKRCQLTDVELVRAVFEDERILPHFIQDGQVTVPQHLEWAYLFAGRPEVSDFLVFALLEVEQSIRKHQEEVGTEMHVILPLQWIRNTFASGECQHYSTVKVFGQERVQEALRRYDVDECEYELFYGRSPDFVY